MKKKWIAVITAVCMISLFGCLHYLHEMQEEKYTVITSVNGVEFDVPKKLFDAGYSYYRYFRR